MTIHQSRATRLYIEYARFIVPVFWLMLAAMNVWEALHGGGAKKYGMAAGAVGMAVVLYFALRQRYLHMRR